jgi:hypothetical protein
MADWQDHVHPTAWGLSGPALGASPDVHYHLTACGPSAVASSGNYYHTHGTAAGPVVLTNAGIGATHHYRIRRGHP